jgi:pimeloyl-ACP methyl ester carboxylesterase
LGSSAGRLRIRSRHSAPTASLDIAQKRETDVLPRDRNEYIDDLPVSNWFETWRTLAAIERHLPSLADRPAALIWGMRDWCFRPDCLERFVKAWPQAEVHRLADVGHWVMEDAPEDSLAIVEKFLAETKCQRQASPEEWQR